MFRVPLASSGLRPEDIHRVNEVLQSGDLTMGSQVIQFEQKMAKYLGTKFFTMVNSGSSANLLMFESLLRPTITSPRLHPGDSVLVPAIAWPTTIWPIIQMGLRPLFIDVDPKTLGIDLEVARHVLNDSKIPIRGIFPIHPLGLTLSHNELNSLVKDFDLVLISDVCESLGSFDQEDHAGTNGEMSSYSFYFSHHITTMEGGGVASNDVLLNDDLRSMRSHGWSRDRTDKEAWHSGQSATDSKFLFVSTGFNFRPMEIQAAIGLLQLERIEDFLSRRRSIASHINSMLIGSNLRVIGFDIFQETPKRHSWMLIPVQIMGANAKSLKHEMIEALSRLGVETRPVLTGNFLAQPAIQRITRERIPASLFPTANEIAETAFLVSCHHDLSDDQVIHLAQSLRSVSDSLVR